MAADSGFLFGLEIGIMVFSTRLAGGSRHVTFKGAGLNPQKKRQNFNRRCSYIISVP